MDLEEFRQYCLSLPATTESMPFGDTVLVFKIADKMFALADLEAFASINLKCDPEIAIELRERYPSVQPGYHMNKQHWNTVLMDGSIGKALLLEWTFNSYSLVMNTLSRKAKLEAGL